MPFHKYLISNEVNVDCDRLGCDDVRVVINVKAKTGRDFVLRGEVTGHWTLSSVQQI